MAFSKLHSRCVVSSLWQEPVNLRVLFFTLMALANRKGEIFGSRRGLEHLANIDVTPEEGDAIWKKMMAPDNDSSDRLRNPENDGRRIEEIEGGFRLVNYEFYRNLNDDDERARQNREAQNRKRKGLTVSQNTADSQQNKPKKTRKKADSQQSQHPSASVSIRQHPSAQAEAEAEAEAEAKQCLPDGAPTAAQPAPPGEVPAAPGTPGTATVPPEKPKKPEPPPSGRTVFIKLWAEHYKEKFGSAYVFDGGRDAKAATELAKAGIPIVDLIETAIAGWGMPGFLGRRAATIHGFRECINEIQIALANPKPPEAGKLSPSMQAALDKDELARVEKALADLDGSYDSHREMTQEDRQKRAAFKLRAQELKARLGFKV